MKKVLITGINSYIGSEFKQYVLKEKYDYQIDFISLRDESWLVTNFSKYDSIIHLAALVHNTNYSEEEYYNINYDLSLRVAKKAKKESVGQFIFFSTMAIYGEEGKVNKNIAIDLETVPNPKTLYGKSKLKAEESIKELSDNAFSVLILRPPMIYGENCPGNFAKLKKLSKLSPFFPYIENERSALSIDNLNSLLKGYIDKKESGIRLPQDQYYMNTTETYIKLRESLGKKTYTSKLVGKILVSLFKNKSIFNKLFGNLKYIYK